MGHSRNNILTNLQEHLQVALFAIPVHRESFFHRMEQRGVIISAGTSPKKYVKTFKMQAALNWSLFNANPRDRQNYWLGVVFVRAVLKVITQKRLWPTHTSFYILNCLTLEHSTCGAEMSSREAASIVDMWQPMVQALQVVIMFSNCVIIFQCFRVSLIQGCYQYYCHHLQIRIILKNLEDWIVKLEKMNIWIFNFPFFCIEILFL